MIQQIISRNSNPLSSINPSPPLGPSSTSSASSSSVLDVSIPLQQDPVIPQASSTTTDPSHTISSSSASASELPSPPPSNAAPTSAPAISSTFASTPGLSPFSGHEWIAAGNMQSLGVKKPSNDHVMLIDTGKEDLPLESFHYMDPKSLANFPIGEKKGVLGCSRLAMNGKFGRHAHSLRQTPVSLLSLFSPEPRAALTDILHSRIANQKPSRYRPVRGGFRALSKDSYGCLCNRNLLQELLGNSCG